ncbi:MAG: penicillin-binding transpeptidase domain-containing protein, partial [Verrucomicrobiales bacterium]
YVSRPRKIRRVISEDTADALREAMLLVTGDKGTGKQAAVEGFWTAGKTGTAYKPKKDRSKGYLKGRYISSFMGFLPAENPRLAGIVIIDDPKGKGADGKDLSRYGGAVAGPVFSEIAKEAMKYFEVKPSIVPHRVVRTRVPVSSVISQTRGDG